MNAKLSFQLKRCTSLNVKFAAWGVACLVAVSFDGGEELGG
jgi:hypothetical protein